jgi:tetratricopeptide (TPR) repeat protein
LILSGCKTEKDAFINKSYHYTTTRFNGYFHGTEAYKTAILNVADNHDDDYENILEIYKHGDETINKAEYTHLNRAINKAAKMIDRHSMIFMKKGKSIEKNKMIDDCYLLIGKARLLKYDLDLAAEAFTFVKTTYEKEPIKYKASLWLIQTNIYQENFVDAETEVKQLLADAEYPKKLKDELLLLQTQIFIKSENYTFAIDSLTKAIDIIKKRKFKHRLKYILAQLHQKAGNSEKATGLFKYVAKKSPDYDLQFNSKISLAKTFNGTGEEVIEIFEKMLKDEKNKEYQDQIYFALAQVYERQNNTDKAIENYKLAAATSVNNPKQKGKAFLALGDYYFNIPKYPLAADYYDSCLISLPKSFATYGDIKKKKNSLTELVLHLNTIETQDSLQRIGKMSEEDRLAFTDELIRTVKLDKELKEIEAEAKRERDAAKALALGSNGESWIFDNPTMLTAGLASFHGIWGDIKLEDNWRRSDKTSISFDNVQASNDALGADLVPENQTVDFYLKGLPKTEEDFKKSDDKLKIAYYELGVIYRDDFNDFDQSNNYFELLNNRYPKHKAEVEALYQLYRNYDKQKNTSKKETNKNLIITEYPNSEYAQLLLNPNMIADKEKDIQASNQDYEVLYNQFKSGDYQGVITSVTAQLPTLKNNALAPRFELLKNFAEGNLYGKDTLETVLRKTQSTYMGTQVANEIDLILGNLTREKNKLQKAKQDALTKEKTFNLTKSEPHYFVLIYSNKTIKSDEISKGISDFNESFFGSKNLQVKTIAWNEDENALIVKPLLSEKDYYQYYTTVRDNFLTDKKSVGDLYFNVSKTNYTKLFKYKEVVNYINFFRKNYFASENKN